MRQPVVGCPGLELADFTLLSFERQLAERFLQKFAAVKRFKVLSDP